MMSFLLNPYIFGTGAPPTPTPEANDMEFWGFGTPFLGVERIATDDVGDQEYWAFGAPAVDVKT